MAEIARLDGCSDCMEVDFVEHEATPEPLMKAGIRLHLAGLSLSNTISEFDDSVSVEPDQLSIIGYRKPSYSPRKGRIRITLRLTRQ